VQAKPGASLPRRMLGSWGCKAVKIVEVRNGRSLVSTNTPPSMDDFQAFVEQLGLMRALEGTCAGVKTWVRGNTSCANAEEIMRIWGSKGNVGTFHSLIICLSDGLQMARAAEEGGEHGVDVDIVWSECGTRSKDDAADSLSRASTETAESHSPSLEARPKLQTVAFRSSTTCSDVAMDVDDEQDIAESCAVLGHGAWQGPVAQRTPVVSGLPVCGGMLPQQEQGIERAEMEQDAGSLLLLANTIAGQFPT